jgi:hypothetical protein
MIGKGNKPALIPVSVPVARTLDRAAADRTAGALLRPVALRGGRELPSPEDATTLVQGGRHVEVAVTVDATGDGPLGGRCVRGWASPPKLSALAAPSEGPPSLARRRCGFQTRDVDRSRPTVVIGCDRPPRLRSSAGAGSRRRGASVTTYSSDKTGTHRLTPDGVTPVEPSAGAVGVTMFAAVLMIMTGLWQAFVGLVAVVNDTFYVATEKYLLQFDVTAWGWIHLVVGVVVLLAGISLFGGTTWSRVVGIIMAGVSALAMFAWMPYYPLWAICVITLDVFVLWALIAHGRDIRTLRG